MPSLMSKMIPFISYARHIRKRLIPQNQISNVSSPPSRRWIFNSLDGWDFPQGGSLSWSSIETRALIKPQVELWCLIHWQKCWKNCWHIVHWRAINFSLAHDFYNWHSACYKKKVSFISIRFIFNSKNFHSDRIFQRTAALWSKPQAGCFPN